MRRLAVVLALSCLTAGGSAARADDAGADDARAGTAGAEDSLPGEATERGHAEFMRGVALTKTARWGEALAAFEEAAAVRDHPRLQYDIGYCLRAIGRYAVARRAFRRALRDPTQLTPGERQSAEVYLGVADGVVARVVVTLDPITAVLTVDNLPLVEDDTDVANAGNAFVASVERRGPAAGLNRGSFVLVLDPGRHAFHASRPGHADVVIERSFEPGQTAELDLRLDLLPAAVSIRSEPERALVSVDRREVGLTPIDLERVAGRYKMQVALSGYVPYASTLDLEPGQRVALTARLARERETLTQKWWFWTGAAAVVAGGVALTYMLTRPTPAPPPYEGGSTGWIVSAKAARW